LGKSCDTAVTDVADYIEKGLNRGQYSLCVFLDIKGAFDNLDLKAAMTHLIQRGAPSWFTTWYKHLIKFRNIKTCYCGENINVCIDNGCTQGGVLSPLFWALIFDYLLILINSNGPVPAVGFADDGAFQVNGDNLDNLFSDMQTALDRAQTWADRFGLTFCEEKTKFMIFGKPVDTDLKLVLNGKRIGRVSNISYLGVTLDDRLSFRPHIEAKINSALGTLICYNNTIRVRCVPRTDMGRWIYTGVIRPAFTYGCHVWSHKLLQKDRLAMGKINRRALLSMSNCVWATPTAAMEVITQIMPLDLHTEKEALLKYSNMNHSLQSGTSKSRGRTCSG
jgi:hypothetical protein